MVEVHSVLVTPASVRQEGHPLGERARRWEQVLGRLGPVHTVLVPVVGQPKDGDHVVSPLPPSPPGLLPKRARQAPIHLGRAARADLDSTPDLVVAVGADVGLVAVGLGAGTGARIAVDLVDLVGLDGTEDDEDEHRHRALIDRLADRVDVLAGGADGEEPVALEDEADVAATAARVRGWLSARRPTPRYRQPAGLLVTEEDDGLVVVDEAESVTHHLNELPAAVFLLVERPMDAAEIVDQLASVTGAPVDEVAPAVARVLRDLTAAGLLLDGPGARRG